MTHSQRAIVLLMLVGISFYGCSKQPADYSAAGGSSSPQAKAQRWEEDYRAAAAARDQYRQKLQAAEEKQAELQNQLNEERANAANDRETLRAEIKLRLSERDSLQSQYDGFRKNLRELLTQAEVTLANPNIPAIPTIPTIPSVPNVPTIPPSSSASPAPALVGSEPAPTIGTTLNN